MGTYLSQLRSDLHAATLARWNRNPPHFYQAGLRDAMHQPPAGRKGVRLGWSIAIARIIRLTILENP